MAVAAVLVGLAGHRSLKSVVDRMHLSFVRRWELGHGRFWAKSDAYAGFGDLGFLEVAASEVRPIVFLGGAGGRWRVRARTLAVPADTRKT